MTPFIHHISLLTRHSKANQHFYLNILGLRFVKHTINQDNHRMIHDYYGNYFGAPGSVITFFVVPHLGQRYDNDHFLRTIGLKVPQGSLPYWENRLQEASIDYQKQDTLLRFLDPDQVEIQLAEVAQPPLDEALQVKNDIPGDKQILGLRSTAFHVAIPEQTQAFFKQLLGWSTKEGRLWLNQTDFIDVVPTHTTGTMKMGRGSIDHVAFSVPDDQALETLHNKALEQGWLVEKVANRGYFRSLYLREPGGNRVEFATLSPGFTLDEQLESLGDGLALPPFLEKQRQQIEKNLYVEK